MTALVSLVVLLMLAACGGDTNGADGSTAMPDEVTVPVTETATSPAVSATDGVVYATSLNADGTAGATWELDIYSPTTGEGGLPVVVLLHGLGATKTSYTDSSEAIAGYGAVVYAVNAPVGGVGIMAIDNGERFREMSEILSCAVGYASATAGEFGGDPDSVVLVAHSYGALYGSWFALGSESIATNWDEFAENHDGPPVQVTCEAEPSTHLAGFVGVGGGRYAEVEQGHLHGDQPDLARVVDPFSYIGHDPSLPIRLLHGESDTTAPPQSSQALHEALLDARYDSHLTFFDGGHVVPPELTHEAATELAGS